MTGLPNFQIAQTEKQSEHERVEFIPLIFFPDFIRRFPLPPQLKM